jgi:hypothetical protein
MNELLVVLKNPVVEFFIILSASIWFLYKFFRTKDLQYVFSVLIFNFIQMNRWPLYLKYELTFGLIALTCVGFLCYERFSKKRLPLRLYVVCFSSLGVFFLVKFALGF